MVEKVKLNARDLFNFGTLDTVIYFYFYMVGYAYNKVTIFCPDGLQLYLFW